MPVFFRGRKPDNIAGSNFFDRAAPALDSTAPCGDDQRLSERVSVPRSTGTRFEGHAGTKNTSWRRCGKADGFAATRLRLDTAQMRFVRGDIELVLRNHVAM